MIPPSDHIMVEGCSRTLLSMLWPVVSGQDDDWDDQLPALLSAYHSTPHSNTGLNPYHIVYGVEMAMHGDRNMWNGCMVNIRNVHTLVKINLERLLNVRREVMTRPVEWLVFSADTGCGVFTLQSVAGNINIGTRLVLAKTSPVTYKIQRHAGAEPKVVYVEKLLP